MSLLVLENIDKYYNLSKSDNFHALKNINLSLNKGEIVSIVGESGSGKSTLMNTIGGLDLDFDGDMKINGSSVKDYSEKEIDEYRKNKIGFIFQSFNLISHLTILDNVTIAMTLSNVSKEKRLERALEILKDVGLEKHINKRPNQLSGGQKQRVAIARALINEPEIILADEPTGALDSKTTEQVLKIISDIAEKGKLVIIVTHSDKVAKMGNRIVRIEDGEIIENIQINQPKEIKPLNTKKDTSHIKDTNIEYLDNKIKISIDDKFEDDSLNVKKTKSKKFRQNKSEKLIQNKSENLSFISAVKLALNNMKQKLGRNLLVAIGSSIGIMSVILMLSVGTGVKAYINGIMSNNLNPLVVQVAKININDPNLDKSTLTEEDFYFNDEDIKKLSNIENVLDYKVGFTESGAFVNVVKYGDKTSSLSMFTSVSPNIIDTQILAGNIPSMGEVMLEINIVEGLGLTEQNALGKVITISMFKNGAFIEKEAAISGVYKVDTGGVPAPINIVYMNYDEIKHFYESNEVRFEATDIYLITDDVKNTQKISSDVTTLGYSQSFAEQMISTFIDMLDVTSYILAAVAAISLFVSAIMILVVLYIGVVERTMEIGVLKAIGARVKDIKRIFMAESFLVGVFGGLFGIIEAGILSYIINKITVENFQAKLTLIEPQFLLFAISVSVAISVIAGLLPSTKAAKLDPIQSLRHD
ncbi:MAG: ATP-binding cassette domain-containing protein [Oscillospiraceae bacterium]